MAQAPDPSAEHAGADWHRRVVDRSLRTATQRSIDRGATLVRAAATLLDRSNGDGFTVQDVADEAGQSLRTLYQYFASKDDLLLAVFEESMRKYARLVREAVAGLDDPLERLAGALIAAVRMPDSSGAGLNGGLSRLRLKLAEVDPELVGRAQAPVTSLFRELVEAAAATGQIRTGDPEAATFLLLSLNTASVTSDTLGNTVGAQPPAVPVLVRSACGAWGRRSAPSGSTTSEARLRPPRPKHAGPLLASRRLSPRSGARHGPRLGRQQAPGELAARQAGQGVEEHHRSRALEVRDAVAAERRSARRPARPRRAPGSAGCTTARTASPMSRWGTPMTADVGHRRVQHQHVLDLAGYMLTPPEMIMFDTRSVRYR